MKTAMQELFDEMTSINWHLYSYEDKIKIINVHFEKEKEQIIVAFIHNRYVLAGGHPIRRDYAEEYYNETYNQNK